MDANRHGKRAPQLVQRWERQENRFILYCAETVLEISVISPEILRFRFAPEGRFDADFSYAIDPAFKPDPQVRAFMTSVGDEYQLETDQIRCVINRTLHCSMYNKAGVLISQDERGFYWQTHEEYGGNVVFCSKKISEQENFFGLGDKPDRSNLRGLRLENWGSDMYGFERTTDPLYKNIPFFYGLHHSLAYGIFFDNTFRTRFDFGYERGDVCTFWAKGGEMNYYFIYGPELLNVAERYVHLTGRPELPPLWALGYHQSRWSYYPESAVQQLAAEFRTRRIPCDSIHLDIDHMDGFRCFTWDKERFPDPRRMIAELLADGFKAVTILDPGIKIDRNYAIHQEALEKGLFCRRADGPLMQGDAWPGACHFPDFTDPRAREWWAEKVEEYASAGIRGIWNDMNEPSLMERRTFPNDTRHNYDGHRCSHRKAHNVYGMQMARATHAGLKKTIFPRRPFSLTRTGYAGMQRYAATWTGDNLSTWGHLWMANIQCQRMSISGLAFVGSDIGGFIGDCSGELLTRWTQLAVLHPFFRNHSSGDHAGQEPWTFGMPYTAAIKKAIELRYQLLPYIYTAFWRHTSSGTPMILPLVFHDQHDPETYYRMEEFSLGFDLVSCPIAAPGAKGRFMYLPKGKWYNYFTRECVEGGKEFWAEAALDTFPLWVRAGCILPHYPVMQYVGESEIEVLDMHVFYSTGPYTSQLYEDAGDYYDHEQGNFMVRSFTLRSDGKSADIQQLKSGRFNSEYGKFRFLLHGFPFVPATGEADGEKFRIKKLNGNGTTTPTVKQPQVYVFETDKNFDELHIEAAAELV
ncbi:MAG: DUF4968 domain-containing protein [Bacteroidetes bacterium]|nr:MAG: DUF4968 domain-containing protein [Bacteroidota bacterium]